MTPFLFTNAGRRTIVTPRHLMGGLTPLNFYKLIDWTSFSKRAIASRVFS